MSALGRITALLVLTSLIYSQSTQDALSYYPLAVGNYWEYFSIYRGEDPSKSIYSARVIGEETLENGKTYKKIKISSYQGSGSFDREIFERIDTGKGLVYRYAVGRFYNHENNEYVIDSLFASMDDVFKSLHFYHEIDDQGESEYNFTKYEELIDEGDGKPVKLYRLDYRGTTYKLKKGIGFYYHHNYYLHGSEYELKLEYARVNGEEWGTKIDTANFISNIVHDGEIPLVFALYLNYPNPFNPTTTISYALPSGGDVTLKIYDVMGREVGTLVNGYQTAGYKQVEFNATGLASGVYFYRITINDFVETKKMLLLK